MSQFSEIIKGDIPVLIDFSAEWCQPCKMMPPILKVDVDKNQAIASQWGIASVPTLMIFNKGQQVFRQSGVIPSNQLVNTLNIYIKK